MRAAIQALPANQQAVLLLAKFEQLSYREIALALGITEGAVGESAGTRHAYVAAGVGAGAGAGKPAIRGFSRWETMMGRNENQQLPELLRFLRGELSRDRAETLRRRLGEDAALRAEYAALKRAWQFAGGRSGRRSPARIRGTALGARARAEGRPGAGLSWSLAPAWAKAAAVLALVAGAAIGSSLMVLGDERAIDTAASATESASCSRSPTTTPQRLQSPDDASSTFPSESRQ